MRSFTRERTTTETSIEVTVDLDGGPCDIATGIRMLDHMLEQFAFHSEARLRVQARSLDGIRHHLVEDVAIVLGEALGGALGDRRGIERFSSELIPMDDALIRVAIDLSGRGYARIALGLTTEAIEDLSSEMVPHFFTSLATNAGITLHIDRLAGSNSHHVVEGAFKGLARACRSAWARRAFAKRPSSTKDVLV